MWGGKHGQEKTMGNQSIRGFEVEYKTEKHPSTRGHGAVLGMARTVEVS